MARQTYGLEHLDFNRLGTIFRNLPVPELVEHEYKNGEIRFAQKGAVMVQTGEHTDRLPKNKFYVDEPGTTENIWWGTGNKKISIELYNQMQGRLISHLSGKDLYVFDGFCGGDPKYRVPVRLISQKAWHAHFFDNLLIAATKNELDNFSPEITIINGSEYQEFEFEKIGLPAKEFILIDLKSKTMLIGGTENSDEMKKGLFSIMNYILPLKGVLTIHGAANIGKEDDVAILTGATGTGKTTLSHDPNMKSWHRKLIGDDAHGWSDEGVFNLENGVYAKCLDLERKNEPDIFNAVRFGAILENVTSDESRNPVYTNSSLTTNGRVSYPLDFIHNAIQPGVTSHANHLIILTNDMFGVLPPACKLTQDQAIYYFLNGYSSIAKTVKTKIEIEAQFSFCFGSGFLTLRPNIYAELLSQKLQRHDVATYMINIGYTGGPYGQGTRIPLEETRKIIEGILDESFRNSIFEKDPIFGFEVPKQITGVDNQILSPRDTWENKSDYDDARRALASMFIDNFEAYAQDGPKTGDIIATKYLYNEYNRLFSAGPHL